MKKIIYSSLFVVATNFAAFAQAVLPTTWGFPNATLPTGWASSGTGFSYYSGSGNPAPAAKFAVTGDMLTVSFTTMPGTLSYDITDNPPTGQTYSSNFQVEESADNSTYTVVGTAYTAQANFGATAGTYYPKTGITLNSATRYVRFHLITKAVGNIGLDNVTITAGVSTAAQISVMQGTTTVLNGGTYTLGSPVSTMLPTTFTVKNTGTVSALNVTAASLSGPAAADYTVSTSMPMAAIASGGTGNLVVNFTPSTSGTRNAVLSLTNDDPTANPYIINLNGVGGNLATEPTAQPSNMTFTNIKTYHISGHFTAASPAPDGYLVLRRNGTAITDVPVDGTVYQRGDMIGNSKVVYSSNATGFFPNDIVANSTYYFTVFAYNGVSTYRNYLTAAPLAGNVTSASASPTSTNYYTGISTANSTFVTDLATKVATHNIQFYSSYGPLLASTYYTRDTTANQRVITSVYSGLNQIYTEPFDWTTYDMSREHSYCQSWQNTVNDVNFQSRGEYNDYHMITPTNQTHENALRSNYPYGVVVGTPTSVYLGCKYGNDINGHKVFEPRDVDKGDAARCMMYECIAYTSVVFTPSAPNTNCTYGGNWSLPSRISNAIPYGQDQNVLKLWNTQDPPDNFEIGRNDYVDSLQHNRNPFIDHPEYVCNIDFSTMTYLATPNCGTTGIDEVKNQDAISFAPNPSNGNFVVNYTATRTQKVTMKLVDMVGRIVYSNEMNVSVGANTNEINLNNLTKGIYTVEIVSETSKETRKLVIQ